MSSLEERLAVLERVVSDNEGEIKAILLDIKEHMENEDERWTIITSQLQALETKYNKTMSFVGGITFTVTAFWSVAIVLWKLFGSK